MIRRGEVWWAQLDVPSGSEPGYRRPVLIVQADEINVSRTSTVVVAPLTSNENVARMPGNVLPSGVAGLPLTSVINVHQLLAIDRQRILGILGRLSDSRMEQVDEGLRQILGLSLFSEP